MSRPDVEEPPAAKEDQSESTQSDSDDCIVHGQAAGRKVSETPLFTFTHLRGELGPGRAGPGRAGLMETQLLSCVDCGLICFIFVASLRFYSAG